MKIGVLGAGSWGTALAKVLADGGHDVILWGRRFDLIHTIQERRVNETYLPGVRLPANLRATSELTEAVGGKALVVSVVPSHATRQVLSEARSEMPDHVVLVGASKGIENDTLATMDEVFAAVVPDARAVFLSGPSFAREVGKEMPTAVVVASHDAQACVLAQQAFANERFRVYTSDDVVGVEVLGALKNVIAIAAGISDGLGFGHNTRAALITRGLAEVQRLSIKRGGNPLSTAGLAGMGDLVLTCTGDLSRNRRVGMELGKGRALEDIVGEMHEVAEGVKTTRSAHHLALREQVEMPITAAVYGVLYEHTAPRAAVMELMGRSLKGELE
jgi:glycerol-3-phosphate dehydrogenase (NAD(P)+)